MFKGFKEFISRGNIVDLAVAVVIGTAFTALVTKFTEAIITPLITRVGMRGQQTNVDFLKIDIGGGQAIDLNILLSAGINFLLIAAVVYYLIVVPFKTISRRGKDQPAAEEVDEQVVLLTEIRDLLAQSAGVHNNHVVADKLPNNSVHAPSPAAAEPR